MVYLGVGEERGRVPAPKSMAMGPERSKPLHNFDLPHLKWGNQRYLRCMKLTSNGADASFSGDRQSPENLTLTRKRELEPEREKKAVNVRDSEKRMRISKSKIDGDVEDGIKAVREKLMFDLKTAADKMKDAIWGKEVADENKKEGEEEEQESPAPAAEVRPWNLRTRRAACKAPMAGGTGKGLKIEEKKPNFSPSRTENGEKSPKLKATSDKTERAKFSVPLSKKEIEEDFMVLLGHRPPRRPKKRPRGVQKQLDTLFPGLWLTEVSADSYKVPEAAENGKR
ncbi:hypothetical protein L6164_001716 [Bauhinia variegata]|uniref:Uncharacterized protein n=1 Tax=Bauhinia variegata TaxID=167791 RepID=A0ACB9Q9W1_BAUVA|nr:hypothetical protein L6164_001716 [Bauhinia variegata]